MKKRKIIALVSMIFAIPFVFQIFTELRQHYRFIQYPCVRGYVVDTRDHTYYREGSSRHYRSYQQYVQREVSYSYVVRGKRYTGVQEYQKPVNSEWHENFSRRPFVHYNPLRPAESFIVVPNVHTGGILSFALFAIGLMSFALYLLDFKFAIQWYRMARTNLQSLHIKDVRNFLFIGHDGLVGESDDEKHRAWLISYEIGTIFDVSIGEDPSLLVLRRHSHAIVLEIFQKMVWFSRKGYFSKIYSKSIRQGLPEFGERAGEHILTLDLTNLSESCDHGWVMLQVDEYNQLHVGNAILVANVDKDLPIRKDQIDDPFGVHQTGTGPLLDMVV